MRLFKNGNILTLEPGIEGNVSYQRRIGYFSGTFDPFHLGHKNVVELVLNYVDEVWVQPHDYNPKKKPIELFYRKSMVSLSLKGIENAFLLEYPEELSRDKYKLMKDIEDTIEGIRIVDIIGQDHLKRTVHRGIDREVICVQRSNLMQISHPRIISIENSYASISSSSIRKNLEKKDFRNLALSDVILKYICQNQLYQ